MRTAAYIGGVLGLALLIALVLRSDFGAILQTAAVAGWQLLWIVPYRTFFFFLYAIAWLALVRPYDSEGRAGLGFVLWVTTVREAIDRLLPVASVGGAIVGVRLLRWRGIAAGPASASVIVETLLTLITLYLFAVIGLLQLSDVGGTGPEYHRLLLVLLFSLPVPAVSALLLRYGSVFERMEALLRPLVGETALSEGAAALDRELRASLRRGWTLLVAGGLQLAALISASFEIWFALRLFGHPVSVGSAVILESMTQALRHVAFIVPAGLGVQEATLVIFGHALGISSELALAVSMAKRMREVLYGIPSLLSWQWLEGRRLRKAGWF